MGNQTMVKENGPDFQIQAFQPIQNIRSYTFDFSKREDCKRYIALYDTFKNITQWEMELYQGAVDRIWQIDTSAKIPDSALRPIDTTGGIPTQTGADPLPPLSKLTRAEAATPTAPVEVAVPLRTKDVGTPATRNQDVPESSMVSDSIAWIKANQMAVFFIGAAFIFIEMSRTAM